MSRTITRAPQADLDVLEGHGAHGYLLHSFLSPIANRGGDAYGGDSNGRMRLALEIAESVRTPGRRASRCFSASRRSTGVRISMRGPTGLEVRQRIGIAD